MKICVDDVNPIHFLMEEETSFSGQIDDDFIDIDPDGEHLSIDFEHVPRSRKGPLDVFDAMTT